MLGKLLIKRREELGLNLKQMSVKVGFGQSYMSDIERNNRVPRNGCSLMKLAKGYDLDFEVILEAAMEKFREESKDDD